MGVSKIILSGDDGDRVLVDLTGDNVNGDALVVGHSAHGADGEVIFGLNPYERTATDAEVSDQADLLEQIVEALAVKGGERDLLKEAIEGATEIYSEAAVMADAYFREHLAVVSVDLPYLTTLNKDYSFYGCTNLKTVNLPLLKNIRVQTFQKCPLEELNFPSVTSVSGSGFFRCEVAKRAFLPSCTYLDASAFGYCYELEYVDIGPLTGTSYVYRSTFAHCTALKTLVMRVTAFKNLENVNAFTGTPIEAGTGYIYVPASLVDRFKAATNWSTFADQFRALEDYTVDGTVTGALDESKI